MIKVSHICLNRDQSHPHLDAKSEQYSEQVTLVSGPQPQSQRLCLFQAQELASNENILLQTLGFDVAIDHPHTHVVKCCQLVKGATLDHCYVLIS